MTSTFIQVEFQSTPPRYCLSIDIQIYHGIHPTPNTKDRCHLGAEEGLVIVVCPLPLIEMR